MKEIKNIVLYPVIFLAVFIFGCAEMRDYTSIRGGAFVLDAQRGFDAGVDKKDYLLISGNIALIIGDSEKEVIFKIGLPDIIERGLDGDGIWLYGERKIDLIFRDERLRGWSRFRYGEDKSK